jgi:autotransporter-associated beta strand protein
VLDLGANHTDSVGMVTLDGGGVIRGTGTSALTSTVSFEMKNGSVLVPLAGSNIALNKTTVGIVTLSSANTYTGLTTITGGQLLYGVSNAIASGGVTVNGATAVLDLGANHTDTVGAVTLIDGSIKATLKLGKGADSGSSDLLQDTNLRQTREQRRTCSIVS